MNIIFRACEFTYLNEIWKFRTKGFLRIRICGFRSILCAAEKRGKRWINSIYALGRCSLWSKCTIENDAKFSTRFYFMHLIIFIEDEIPQFEFKTKSFKFGRQWSAERQITRQTGTQVVKVCGFGLGKGHWSELCPSLQTQVKQTIN